MPTMLYFSRLYEFPKALIMKSLLNIGGPYAEDARPEVLRCLPYGAGDLGLYELPSLRVVCALQVDSDPDDIRWHGGRVVKVNLLVAPTMPTYPGPTPAASRDASRLIEVDPDFEDAAEVALSLDDYVPSRRDRLMYALVPEAIKATYCADAHIGRWPFECEIVNDDDVGSEYTRWLLERPYCHPVPFKDMLMLRELPLGFLERMHGILTGADPFLGSPSRAFVPLEPLWLLDAVQAGTEVKVVDQAISGLCLLFGASSGFYTNETTHDGDELVFVEAVHYVVLVSDKMASLFMFLYDQYWAAWAKNDLPMLPNLPCVPDIIGLLMKAYRHLDEDVPDSLAAFADKYRARTGRRVLYW
jgi:hypothetical protein